MSNHQGHHTENEGEGRHHDRPEPQLGPLRCRGRQSHAPLLVKLFRKFDDQDGVLRRQSDKSHDSDLHVNVVVEAAQLHADHRAQNADGEPE